MSDDETRNAGDEPGAQGLSRPLLRRLDRHATAAAALRRAEAAYRETSARPPAERARAGRVADRVGAAFEILAESVVELQSSHTEVLSQALEEGLSPDQVRGLDAAFARDDRELAAYLEARTYDQVRTTASRPH